MRSRNWMVLGPVATAAALLALPGCDEEPSKLAKVVNSEPDTCEIPDQKDWVFETMRDAYLWNDELPSLDAFDMAQYETPEDVLAALKVEIDRWSRINDKSTSDALFMEGMTLAFGIGTTVTTGPDGEERVQVRYTDVDSPAAMAGIKRGDVLLEVDGVEALQADWGPREEGVSRTVRYIPREELANADPQPVEVTMQKDWYRIITVPEYGVIDTGGAQVGYLMFTSHLDPSRDELDEAFASFKDAGITKLVVDLRYNGGGLVAISRHLMHLIAGKQHEGSVAYQVVYNDNLSESDTTRELVNIDKSVAIDEVAFITTGRTASASELVINAMIPHIETHLVGSTTSGKPVGMNRFEFCEKLLWPITFKFVNADGNADYFEGFDVDCPSSDDLMYDYGDENEAMIAAALEMITQGTCTEPYAPQFPVTEHQLHPIERDAQPYPGALVTDIELPPR